MNITSLLHRLQDHMSFRYWMTYVALPAMLNFNNLLLFALFLAISIFR